MTNREFENLLSEALLHEAQDYCASLPTDQDLHKQFPDTAFMDAALERRLAGDSAKPVPKRRTFWRQVGHTAAMLLLGFGLLFGLLMTNTQARAFVYNLVMSWYEDHVEYSLQEETNGALFGEWEIGYIPEGFESVSERQNDNEWSISYEGEGSAILDIFISTGIGRLYLDNEHYDMSRLPLRDGIADIYRATDLNFSNMIVFYDEIKNIMFHLTGDVSIDELILVLENIQPRP